MKAALLGALLVLASNVLGQEVAFSFSAVEIELAVVVGLLANLLAFGLVQMANLVFVGQLAQS